MVVLVDMLVLVDELTIIIGNWNAARHFTSLGNEQIYLVVTWKVVGYVKSSAAISDLDFDIVERGVELKHEHRRRPQQDASLGLPDVWCARVLAPWLASPDLTPRRIAATLTTPH